MFYLLSHVKEQPLEDFMKRGPPPTKGFNIAIPIAMGRGSVMLFQLLPNHVCDFTITSNGIFALVRIVAGTRLHANIAEISWKYSGAITGLCTIPFGGPVSRELWLYSRYGTMRFFRVLETGLVEIDCHGFSFVNGKPVVALPAIPGANPCPYGPTIPVPAMPVINGLPNPGPDDSKSPIIRWLRKKNAGKKPEPDENNPTGLIDPSSNTTCPHKKPAANRNGIPADIPVVPSGEPVAAGSRGLSREDTPVNNRDSTTVMRRPEGTK